LSFEQRHVRRQTESLPIMTELYTWIEKIHPGLVPKSPIYEATRYAIRQKEYWVRCFSDGRFEIDNGEVERQLRRVATGRRNYLFAGSDDGAVRLATAYTVLACCRMHGVDPLAYMTDVLRKISDDWPNERLDDLLPHRWAALRAA
jgi:transposase